MPKNVQTTVQPHSFHMLARLHSKAFKLTSAVCEPRTSRWYKLGFKEEQEVKLSAFTGWWRKQGNSRGKKIYICFTDYRKLLTVWIPTKLWRILEMRLPDHLTYLLRSMYVDQKATIRTWHRTTDWFKIGKGVQHSCILSLCLFNLYAEYIMRNAVLDEAQAWIKTARRNNNLR